MYYLSDHKMAQFRRGRKEKSDSPSTGRILANAAGTGSAAAGTAFVGLASTARNTPDSLLRYQLRGYDTKGSRKGLSKITEPIMRRVVGDKSIFGNIREQSINHLQKAGYNTAEIVKAKKGKALKDAVSNLRLQRYVTRGVALNENLPLQSKVAGTVGLAAAGISAARALHKRRKKNKGLS
jgi:hypothetical protein